MSRDAEERRPRLALGEGEDLVLGLVEEGLDVGRRLVAAHRDLGAGLDQRAQDRLVLHDARVVGDVGGGRHALGQLGQIRRAADVLQLVAPAQRVGERDQIDRLVALAELDDRAHDLAVRLAVEVLRDDQLDGTVEGVVVEQDAAQHRLLRLDAVRRHLAELVSRHAAVIRRTRLTSERRSRRRSTARPPWQARLGCRRARHRAVPRPTTKIG